MVPAAVFWTNAPGALRLRPLMVLVTAVVWVRAGEDRLIRFDVLVPEDGTPGALAVRVRPLTVTPAPVLALAKVRLSRLELFEVKAVSLSDMLLALVEELEILIRAPVALA